MYERKMNVGRVGIGCPYCGEMFDFVFGFEPDPGLMVQRTTNKGEASESSETIPQIAQETHRTGRN